MRETVLSLRYSKGKKGKGSHSGLECSNLAAVSPASCVFAVESLQIELSGMADLLTIWFSVQRIHGSVVKPMGVWSKPIHPMLSSRYSARRM